MKSAKSLSLNIFMYSVYGQDIFIKPKDCCIGFCLLVFGEMTG